MAETFTVRVTVPDGFLGEHDVPVVEEMISAACAQLNGHSLSVDWESDDYDASIVDGV